MLLQIDLNVKQTNRRPISRLWQGTDVEYSTIKLTGLMAEWI